MMRKLRATLICTLLALVCSFIVGCGPKFEITFNGNGGTLVSGSEYQTVSDISEIIQPVYEKEGYDFMGFDKELSQISGGTKTTLNAVWEAKKFTITLVVGNKRDRISAVYDDEYKLPILEKEHYSFVGWSLDKDSDDVIDNQGIYKYTEDVSLYSIWKPTEYSISYNLDGGTLAVNNPTTYNIESEIVFNSPEKVGYDFAGWVSEETNAVISKIEKGTYGTINLIATYTPKTFTINIDANGGSCSANRVSVKYDGMIDNLPVPSRVGFTFDGWYLSTNNSRKIHNGEKYQFTDNITIVASWSSNPYSITYKLEGGTLAQNNPGSYSVEDEIELNSPIKTGYTFIGWKEEGVSGYIDKIELGSTGDKVLTAVYTANKYKLTLNTLGGTANVTELEVTYDSPIGVLPEAVKKGYNHNGYTVEGVRINENSVWKYTNDMTAEAVYSLIKYALTYDLDGGKILENRTSYTIEGLDGIIDPTRANSTFEGWEIVGTNKVITDGKIPAGTTGDLTLKAKWSFKFDTITVKFVLIDNSLDSDKYPINTSTVNGMSTIPSVTVAIGGTLGDLLPVNVIPDAGEEFIFKGFYVLNGERHTLRQVKATTVLDEEFFGNIDLGEDGVLVLYARLQAEYLGPY